MLLTTIRLMGLISCALYAGEACSISRRPHPRCQNSLTIASMIVPTISLELPVRKVLSVSETSGLVQTHVLAQRRVHSANLATVTCRVRALSCTLPKADRGRAVRARDLHVVLNNFLRVLSSATARLSPGPRSVQLRLYLCPRRTQASPPRPTV